MKILLFNLGTIEHRIIGWGIEGFKSLFEQDIILWGPIPDKILVYENKEIPILSFFEQTSISDIFKRLPKDWYPDVVTCETSVLNYVPDIYNCPVKTILFTRDAWSDSIFNKNLVEFFDFLNHATIDRCLYSAFHVNMLPLSNCAVSIPGTEVRNTEFEKREIDVIAIANYDNSFYHERYKTFYKLSDSNKSGIKIKYFRGIKRPEISNYYQRSKIVLDWAHTLSNRSYEAALNGCLLFSHEDNQMIKEFWIPWEEYIPFNENNILELVTYYIENPDNAKRVVNKAVEKIRSLPSSWGGYVWENINIAFDTSVSIQKRIEHIESLPLTTLHFCTATPFLYNYDYKTDFPSNWKELYFNRIDFALSEARDQNAKIVPLVEAARLAFLLNKTELSLKYLDELQKILPDYAWIYYIQARIYFKQGENNVSLQLLKKSVESALKAPVLLQQYVLPVIEDGNPCDGRRITSYMWQSVYNHNNEFQVNALLNLSYELSGDIYRRINEHNKAINSYFEASNYVLVPECIYKLSHLLIQSMEYEELLRITGKGIEDSPYDSILILYKAYALIQLNQKRKAFLVLKEHKEALRSFVNVRQIIVLRIALFFIMLFVFLGKHPNSEIIIELIRILKKKIGFSYLE